MTEGGADEISNWEEKSHLYMGRAYDTLEDARLLVERGHSEGALNRLYYACFYGAMALLMTLRLDPKTHRGTQTLFSKHFVKDGRFPPDDAKTIRILSDLRNETDYDVFFEPDKEEVSRLVSEAEHFVDICDELINAQ